MHLGESLALAAGVPISNQKLYPKYYPLGVDKFISFHKIVYEQFQEVINLLKPILDQYDVKIVQIGGANYNHTKSFPSIKEYNHAAYILEKSLLHFGEYSILFDIAASIGCKRLILNSISHPRLISPPIGNKDQEEVINNYTKEGSLPFYDAASTKDLINQIKPETIVEKICSMLGINFKKPYETIYKGSLHKENGYEINVYPVKNFVYNLKNVAEPIIRLDFSYNLEFLETHLKLQKFRIRTDKEIPEQILSRHKDKILGIDLEIKSNENFDKFIKIVKKNKIPILVFSFLKEEEAADIKLTYLDIEPINFQNTSQKTIDLKQENLYFKCDELICYKNDLYITKDDIINGNKYDANKFNRVADFDLTDSVENCLFVKLLTE